MRTSIPPVVDERWAIPENLWMSIGGDYVFICRAEDRAERWFRLRQDLATGLLDSACAASPKPWTGILEAYQEGIGPAGEEPWIAPDFDEVLAHLSAPTDETLTQSRGSELIAARAALVEFLIDRRGHRDMLIVDDGTGTTREFFLPVV
jgi:hypothetical protein